MYKRKEILLEFYFWRFELKTLLLLITAESNGSSYSLISISGHFSTLDKRIRTVFDLLTVGFPTGPSPLLSLVALPALTCAYRQPLFSPPTLPALPLRTSASRKDQETTTAPAMCHPTQPGPSHSRRGIQFQLTDARIYWYAFSESHHSVSSEAIYVLPILSNLFLLLPRSTTDSATHHTWNLAVASSHPHPQPYSLSPPSAQLHPQPGPSFCDTCHLHYYNSSGSPRLFLLSSDTEA